MGTCVCASSDARLPFDFRHQKAPRRRAGNRVGWADYGRADKTILLAYGEQTHTHTHVPKAGGQKLEVHKLPEAFKITLKST